MLGTDTPINFVPHTTLSRELLRIYAVYRLVLTLIIWVLFLTDTVIGQDQPKLFISSCLAYLVFNGALIYAANINWQPNFLALFFIVASDIVAIQLIAQSSGT